MTRRATRCITEPEKAEVLHRVRAWRQDCIALVTRAPIGEPLYRSVSRLIDAIDGVAEAITGDRRHFHPDPSPSRAALDEKALREAGEGPGGT